MKGVSDASGAVIQQVCELEVVRCLSCDFGFTHLTVAALALHVPHRTSHDETFSKRKIKCLCERQLVPRISNNHLLMCFYSGTSLSRSFKIIWTSTKCFLSSYALVDQKKFPNEPNNRKEAAEHRTGHKHRCEYWRHRDSDDTAGCTYTSPFRFSRRPPPRTISCSDHSK